MPSVLYPFLPHNKPMRLKVFIPNWEERKPKFRELKKTIQYHRALTLIEVLIGDKLTCLENNKKWWGKTMERETAEIFLFRQLFFLQKNKIGLIESPRRCHGLAQKSAIQATCSSKKAHLKTGSKNSRWGQKSVFSYTNNYLPIIIFYSSITWKLTYIAGI